MRFKTWSWIFIPFLMAALRATGVAQIATTQIVDTIYRADGTAATGTALIAWPAFTTSAGDQVPAGNTSAVIGTGGALNLQLIANSGALPIGTYYTVTYHLDDNSVTRQYWVVPQSANPVKIAAIQSTVLPVSIAIQTATKSYVDTAIAAATTGHPLDSSPLVLKSGDTMTGPLVLPADPVSSLQASTKHYVDASVAAGVANSSTLTGQTPNYVPLATSSTASTTSSHFYESNGTSGVTNPFQMTASSPNCNLNGATFIRWGCNNINIFDDGTQDAAYANSLTGTLMTMQAWGSGGAGNTEGRSTILFADSNNGAMVTSGGKFGWSSNTNFFGIGDVLANKNVHECHGGLAYASDQGCQLVYERLTDGGFWHGSVAAGGTNTHPNITASGGCSNQENQSCAPSNGWIMVDTNKLLATGHITSAPTGSLVSWLSTSPTDMTLPIPSAWGTALNIHIVAGTPWNNPPPQTITIGAGGGTGSGAFAAGDLACVIGNQFHEQEIISAVSGSAGSQTITIPLSRPEDSVLVVKGQCGYVMSVANDAHGMTYVLPATSIDGSHILIGRVGFSGVSGWEGGYPGSEWWTTGTGTNSAVNYYAGARILWVGTSSPGFDPFGTHMLVQLEPNTFSAGDSLESPDYPLQKFDGEEENVDMQLPSNNSGSLSGKILRLTGPGFTGDSAALRISNEQDASTYTPGGGPLSEPNLMSVTGGFDNLIISGNTPLHFGFRFNGHQAGQTSYEVWHDPSWGILSIDNTDTWHFTNSNISVDQGYVNALGGIFSGYGMRTGAGDGGHNGAGLDFSWSGAKTAADSWLTPCDLSSDNSKTDLCVTSQGMARFGTGQVTADRSLQVNNLLINGTCTGCGGASIPSSTNVLSGNGSGGVNATGLDVTHIASGGANTTLSFGSNFGVDALDLYVSGGDKYGWGLNGGEMQFFVQDDTTTHFSFNAASGGLQPSGTNEYARLTPRTLGGGWTLGTGELFSWSSTGISSGTVDTGLSRVLPGVVNVGNGTVGDASGTVNAASINAQLYKGPASAPSGACSDIGWAFSQDGHISYCNGTAWIQKM